MSWVAVIVLGLMLSVCQRASAVITADQPLKQTEAVAQFIFIGKVEKFFADKPAMLVTISEDIKGKAPFRSLPINCKVADPKEAKDNLIEPLVKRLGPDIDIVFFVSPQRGKSYVTFAYTNGTWFHLHGTQTGEKDQVVFRLKSAEPYLRKSFKGTTEDLRQLMKNHAAGKAALPPIDAKIEPGLGPEYQPMKKSSLRSLDAWGLRPVPALSAPGAPFAVIPTIGIGGPLIILALLFPTVFGGVLVLFRQWMAFITLISLSFTLMLVHWLLAPTLLRGTWWSTDAALWFLMCACTFVCACWAWRRQLNFLYSGEADASQRTELNVLGIMTSSCALMAALMWYFMKPSWIDANWALTVVLTLGLLCGTVYRLYHALKTAPAFASPPLATEGIILGAMLLGELSFAPKIWAGGVGTEGAVEASSQTGKGTGKLAPVVKKWDFNFAQPGAFASAPLIHGDLVYAAFSETGLRTATLLCLDRHTGVKKWEFLGKDDDLVQMISSPCLSDGKLYFGEGFHDDKNCKVYCVDAADGKEIWRFKTGGQTESSPAVAAGKVYIGAGNDGVYCLDAATGQMVWKFPPADYKGRLLRFGGGMCVAGNRLYCGTGVDRNQQEDKGETAVYCLDAPTGKLFWKSPVPYPVWSTPVVKDGSVYVTTGNGDVFEDAKGPDVPGGAALCFDADTGKEKWRVNVANGIMEAPALDAHRLYFGCRDGHLYCLDRADGKEHWRRMLDTPIISTPALDVDARGERTFNVFATASGGKVCCLNPRNGDIEWTYDLTKQLAYISAAPRLLVTPTPDGYLRQLYFGAGIGGGALEFNANRPVFYCLEEPLR
jgi:outer membrane protein assembly factor BamB